MSYDLTQMVEEDKLGRYDSDATSRVPDEPTPSTAKIIIKA